MLSMAFALFLLMDPIGNVPLFVSILKGIPQKRHLWIISRELVIALSIMIGFAFIGDALLHFLKITTPTLLISGGVILFLIALKMIFPSDHPRPVGMGKEPLVVPLATPFVAGPAVLAAVMLYAGQRSSMVALIGAIFLAWAASTLILLTSSFWKKRLGEQGLTALERLMGLILTLIAVQMFFEGLLQFLKNPPP